MRANRVKIILDASADGAVRTVKGFRKQLYSLKDAAFSVRGAIGGIVSAAALDQLRRYADAAILMENQLQRVGGSMENVFEIAQRTNSTLKGTANLYTRMALSLQGLGVSQADIARVTETLNKAMIISGASSEEAARALVQLSQSFQGGIMRAEEWNSVIESGPALLQLMADHIDGAGGSIGRLRQIMLEGKLTSEVMFRALQQGAADADEAFSRMRQTTGQAFTRLDNAFTKAIGTIDRMEGASGGLADTINWLAEVVSMAPRAWAGFKSVIDAFMFGFTELDILINRFIASYYRAVKALNDNPIGDFFVSDSVAAGAEKALSATEAHIKDQKLLLEEIRTGWKEHFDQFKNGVNFEPVKRQVTHLKKTLGQVTDETARQNALLKEQERLYSLKKQVAFAALSEEQQAIERINQEYDKQFDRLAELVDAGRMTMDEASKYEEIFSGKREDALKKLTGQQNNVLRDAVGQNRVATDTMALSWQDMAKKITSATDIVGNLLEGKFDNIGDAFRRLCDQMVIDWINAQIKMAMEGNSSGILGMVMEGISMAGSFFGAAGGMGGMSTEMGAMSSGSTYAMNADLVSSAGQASFEVPWYAAVSHSGWHVGMEAPPAVRAVSPALFHGAPRFHKGLKPDEFPAILQKGETVVPRGGRLGGNMTVNIYQAAGTKARTEEREDSQGNLTLDVIIENVEGSISRNVARGKGSLAGTLQQVYGLNRAAGAV